MITRVLAALASAAIVTLSMSAGTTPVVRTLSPEMLKALKDKGRILMCAPDPAIESVTLTKLFVPGHPERPTGVTVSYVVRNKGLRWNDPAGAIGGVYFTTHNATRDTFSIHQNLPVAAAPGAVMVSYTSPTIGPDFGADEFVGFVDVRLLYNPDDNLDGNPCNDDQNANNNVVRIEDGALTGFLFGHDVSKTFH